MTPCASIIAPPLASARGRTFFGAGPRVQKQNPVDSAIAKEVSLALILMARHHPSVDDVLPRLISGYALRENYARIERFEAINHEHAASESAMISKTPDSAIYQLKVTLKHSKPPIWRRIQVRADVTLYDLHEIIQIAMGWTDSHLHQFMANDVYYGEPNPDFGFDVANERRVRLHELVSEVKDKILYEYDFGDGWEHGIVLEKVPEPEPNGSYPRCISGRRQCPPEDVGGIWGYYHFWKRSSRKVTRSTRNTWSGSMASSIPSRSIAMLSM